MKKVLLLSLLVACSTTLNPKYCDQKIQSCGVGMICDYVAKACKPAPPDMATPTVADLAELPDLTAPGDLTPFPDLSPLLDLTPLPDLVQFPDLAPLPVYFNPDVQAILDVGGNGGCARAGCHNASDGLYIPFLIPSPAPTMTAAIHANYLSFVAEPSTTVLQKLVKNSGTAHGGTMTSVDRKPCSTVTSEPCASLVRWYAEASPAPEVAP